MPAVVVIGGQGGDVGKGRVVDLIAPGATVVARYSAGNNAGHTVINDEGVTARVARAARQAFGDSAVGEGEMLMVGEDVSAFLEQEQLVIHPFVIGELALGSFRHPERILRGVKALPHVAVATPEEVLQFIDRNRLGGSGIGYVDAHLLAAVRLTPGLGLWTRDRALHTIAHRLGLAFEA